MNCCRYDNIPAGEGDDAINICCDNNCRNWCSFEWFWNYLHGGTLSDDQRNKVRERMDSLGGVQNVETFLIHAESVRQIAYGLFWITMIMAFIFTKLMIDPSTIIHSDLKKMFGYNNICVLFDYSPSREYVAMIYPMFEYAFFTYIILDYIHLRLACKNVQGYNWLVNMGTLLLPIKLVLIAWFRMIFVYSIVQPVVPYGVRGVVGHTMAFIGMQIGLIIVAFENIVFIWMTNIEFVPVDARTTKVLTAIYFFLFASNTTFQMWFAFGLFWHDYPTLNVQGDHPNPTHQLIILIVDRMWLILVGILPLVFAQIGRKTQAHIRVTMELNSAAWENAVDVVDRTVLLRTNAIG